MERVVEATQETKIYRENSTTPVQQQVYDGIYSDLLSSHIPSSITGTAVEAL